MDDIRNLTDEELQAVRQEIAEERARRETLLSLPAAVADLAKQYAAAGGEPEELVQAVMDPDSMTPDNEATEETAEPPVDETEAPEVEGEEAADDTTPQE